jgi:predicted  nucleic acid-binding Zn-ribbon protein
MFRQHHEVELHFIFERIHQLMTDVTNLTAAVAKLTSDQAANATKQATDLAAIAAEITNLQTQIAALSANTAPSQDQIDALTASVTAVDTAINAQQALVDAAVPAAPAV